MTIEMPAPIARYFAADKGKDPDAVAACFTEDALVRDEGKTHSGSDAIRRWKADAASQYSYVAEPVEIAQRGGRIVVTSHLVGDFPGSPVDLRYCFGLQGDRIADLEIIP